MLRDVGAVILGLVVSFGVIMGIQMIGHAIWPPPEGLNRNDMDALQTYVSQLPFLALLAPIASYFFGALAGPFVASKIGMAQPKAFAAIIGLILLAATVANLIQIPHPVWFSVLAVAAVFIGAWLALQLSTGAMKAQQEEA